MPPRKAKVSKEQNTSAASIAMNRLSSTAMNPASMQQLVNLGSTIAQMFASSSKLSDSAASTTDNANTQSTRKRKAAPTSSSKNERAASASPAPKKSRAVQASATAEIQNARLSAIIAKAKSHVTQLQQQAALPARDLANICDQLSQLSESVEALDKEAAPDCNDEQKSSEESDGEADKSPNAKAFASSLSGRPLQSIADQVISIVNSAGNNSEDDIKIVFNSLCNLLCTLKVHAKSDLRCVLSLLVFLANEFRRNRRERSFRLSTIFDLLHNFLGNEDGDDSARQIFIHELQGLELCHSFLNGPMQYEGGVMDSLCNMTCTALSGCQDAVDHEVRKRFMAPLLKVLKLHSSNAAVTGNINSLLTALLVDPTDVEEALNHKALELLFRANQVTHFDTRVVSRMLAAVRTMFECELNNYTAIFAQKAGFEALRDIVKAKVGTTAATSSDGNAAATASQSSHGKKKKNRSQNKRTNDHNEQSEVRASKLSEEEREILSDAIQIPKRMFLHFKSELLDLTPSQAGAVYELCTLVLQYELSLNQNDRNQELIINCTEVLDLSVQRVEPFQTLFRDVNGIQVCTKILEVVPHEPLGAVQMALKCIWYSQKHNLRNSIEFVRLGGLELIVKLGNLHYQESMLPMYLCWVLAAVCAEDQKHETDERPSASANAALIRGFIWKSIAIGAIPMLLRIVKEGRCHHYALSAITEFCCNNHERISFANDDPVDPEEAALLHELKLYRSDETPLEGPALKKKIQDFFLKAKPDVLPLILDNNALGLLHYFIRPDDKKQQKLLFSREAVSLVCRAEQDEPSHSTMPMLAYLTRYAPNRTSSELMESIPQLFASAVSIQQQLSELEEPHPVGMHYLACTAELLQNLSAEPECKSHLLTSGADELLVYLLRFEQEEVQFMSRVTSAIHAFCTSYSSECISVFRKAGIVEDLVALASHYSTTSQPTAQLTAAANEVVKCSTQLLLMLTTPRQRKLRSFDSLPVPSNH